MNYILRVPFTPPQIPHGLRGRGRNEKCIITFQLENLTQRDYFKNVSMIIRTLLRYTLWKYRVK